MQKREKVHKIDEKGVKVECANIQIFARTQHNHNVKAVKNIFLNII